MEFNFDTRIIDKVAKEIKEAEKYVRIAIFQIHNGSIYDALDYALQKKVVVEVFTLPYDSINADIRDKVENRIEGIRRNGATLYFSKWGIGDPERTTTAVGRWYSFHGKFLVTDKAAISISANLTNDPELDAMLVYREKEKIDEFNEKFKLLVEWFYKGNIKSEIEKTDYSDKETLFLAPRTINDPEVKSHWIRDYPSQICNTINTIKDGLYISPFECRARDLVEKIINEAKEYVYISTESFTDTDIIQILISNSIKVKTIRILTNSESQDFNDRIRELYPRLMANKIELKKPGDPLHAKLIITDQRLVVSSVNLNKMNLGYSKKKALWRANTETITVESNHDIIGKAKLDYEEIFKGSISLLDYLSEKETDYAVSIFSVYGIKPDKEVKKLFSRFIVLSDIKLKKNLYLIGKYASILVKKFNKSEPTIKKQDFLCAMVLYFLSDRKHTEQELKEKLSEIYYDTDIKSIIGRLLEHNLITKNEDFYQLSVEKLLGEPK
jgi:phosphatidylserine/phosphatidylglycerophosphate/cardiolipin synthase-like enzyme